MQISRAQEFSELQTRQVKELAEDAVHRRFGDMFKAFQYLDIDGSGKPPCNSISHYSSPLYSRALSAQASSPKPRFFEDWSSGMCRLGQVK